MAMFNSFLYAYQAGYVLVLGFLLKQIQVGLINPLDSTNGNIMGNGVPQSGISFFATKRWFHQQKIPSGYLWHSHGKSTHFLIGKPSTIGPFPMAMLNNQRVRKKRRFEQDRIWTIFVNVNVVNIHHALPFHQYDIIQYSIYGIAHSHSLYIQQKTFSETVERIGTTRSYSLWGARVVFFMWIGDVTHIPQPTAEVTELVQWSRFWCWSFQINR